MKKGFTLVELSIVLVIIGLLIGGILVGQSLVESANVQAFGKQMSQYKIAIEQFHLKYNRVPGDSEFHDGVGDGDGKLEDANVHSGGQTSTWSTYSYETPYFWAHLWDDGFLQNSYPRFNTDPTSGMSVAKGHYPKLAMGKGADFAGAVPYASDSGNRILIWGIDFSQTTTATTSSTSNWYCAFTPIEALSLDKKFDDGNADRSTEYSAGYVCETQAGTGTGTNNCYDGSGNYSVSSGTDSKECVLFVDMFKN